ncbi:MAG TPA: TlpA disulfide reductase family protein [Bryobacteraceae bacterium]|jgi:peroxiredoxin|nr:TlpA disulfide reductase family protein [Bryobacteraceae bacterium]
MKAFVLVLLSSLALFAAGSYSNRRAPGFSLMDAHYRQHDIQDYRGKAVIVDFMQTGCPVCNSLADLFVQVTPKYGDKMAILSVVTLPDNFTEADKFSARHKANWPILFDSGQVMMSYLKLQPTGDMNVHFPHIFLVDVNGIIRNDLDGPECQALTPASLSAEIDKLLK